MNNFPWEMNKPIEEIEGVLSKNFYYGGFEDEVAYLLARLKKAESERDSLQKCLDDYDREQY